MTNGEKFNTASERLSKFYEFCGNNVCNDCKAYSEPRERSGIAWCIISWLDLEAEDEKPLPCPFCGGEMNVFASNCCIHCNCGYSPSYFGDGNLSKVIAAHNRVAKAVMESEAKK